MLYLTIAAATIAGPDLGSLPLLPQAIIYLAFILIEFLVLCYLLVRNFKDGIEPLFFGVAVAVLLVLPLFKFGPNNDLVMRSSIPALAAVMFAVVDGWARPRAAYQAQSAGNGRAPDRRRHPRLGDRPGTPLAQLGAAAGSLGL